MKFGFQMVRRIALFLILALALSSPYGLQAAVKLPGAGVASANQNRPVPSPVPESHAFINYRNDGAVGCRDATSEEAQLLKRRVNEPMHHLSAPRQKNHLTVETQSTGLQIVLRGTNQLENFPAAKAAFLAAAARWQAVIATPITVVIDVDFGATWFGEAYDDNVLGQTDSQLLGDSSIYSEVRDSLIGLSLGDNRTALYNQLPLSTVPTDIGNTNYVTAPSALWRTLGFISPVADPTAEQNALGSPPAVGFNSQFDYDFDPSNGISANTIDFDAVAVHEIGHVLGFDSDTGYRELVRSAPLSVSVWDMFRFRPGISLDTFTTAERILSSGGTQNFFDGTQEIGLSTGRPDGTGGDREQSSHWKDDRLTGQHIGIMDPTLADGVRETITDRDLAALKIFGYGVGTAAASPDSPTLTDASYSGKKLRLKGSGLSGQVDLEINGLVVSSGLTITLNDAASKLVVKAKQAVLNLQSGANQIVVIANGARSNAFTLTL
jgi:hypothetical protein